MRRQRHRIRPARAARRRDAAAAPRLPLPQHTEPGDLLIAITTTANATAVSLAQLTRAMQEIGRAFGSALRRSPREQR